MSVILHVRRRVALRRNSILAQLTEKRDRCQSHAATAIPSATNAAHDVCLGASSPGTFDAMPAMTGSDVNLGFNPRHHGLRAARGHGLRSGCAARSEEGIGRLDGAIK